MPPTIKIESPFSAGSLIALGDALERKSSYSYRSRRDARGRCWVERVESVHVKLTRTERKWLAFYAAVSGMSEGEAMVDLNFAGSGCDRPIEWGRLLFPAGTHGLASLITSAIGELVNELDPGTEVPYDLEPPEVLGYALEAASGAAFAYARIPQEKSHPTVARLLRAVRRRNVTAARCYGADFQTLLHEYYTSDELARPWTICEPESVGSGVIRTRASKRKQ